LRSPPLFGRGRERWRWSSFGVVDDHQRQAWRRGGSNGSGLPSQKNKELSLKNTPLKIKMKSFIHGFMAAQPS